jgi:zinc protease
MLKYRTSKPLPADEYKFTIPEIQNFRTKSGLNVHLVERHNLPIIRMNMMAGCGSKIDPFGKKGIANLFAMTIDEGAGDYNALQLSNEFDTMGTDFDIHCTNDNIYFLSRFLKENLEKSFDLFSTVLLKSHFDEEAFKKEKRKVLTRMLQTRDDPDEIASNAFEYLIFNGNHPYAFPIIGKEEDIKKIEINDLRKFYNSCLLPSGAHLVMVGDITRQQSEELVDKYLSEWMPKSNSRKKAKDTLKHKPGVFFVDKPGSVQSEIRLGHITECRNETNYFPRLLMNMILGGQFSSRINLNLRENKGYTYGAFSNFNFLKDAAYFFVSTSVGQENTLNAINEIKKELYTIKSGVTEEELTFAKTSLMRKFPSNFETNGQIASSISRLIMYDLPDNHFNNYIQHIHDVNIEQVNKAAEDYIHPGDMTILVVGNKADIKEQLKDEENLTELNIHGEVFD